MTRATIIWFVGAAVVGAIAGGLHLLRSDIGGSHTGVLLTVCAYALTGLSAAMLYHGVVVAAREQDGDEAADPAYDPGSGSAPADDPTVYTFRRGKPVVDRPRRPPGRD